VCSSDLIYRLHPRYRVPSQRGGRSNERVAVVDHQRIPPPGSRLVSAEPIQAPVTGDDIAGSCHA